jgi:hypothetical protein
MIDWLYVVRNALWILGLSIGLAGASYASWWAAGNDKGGAPVRWRELWGLPVFSLPFSAGMVLFCVSLAWGSTRPWEMVVWGLLGVAFAAQFVMAWRSRAAGQ